MFVINLVDIHGSARHTSWTIDLISSFAAFRSSGFLLFSNFCNNKDFSPFKIDILLVSFFETEDLDCGTFSNNKSYRKKKKLLQFQIFYNMYIILVCYLYYALSFQYIQSIVDLYFFWKLR